MTARLEWAQEVGVHLGLQVVGGKRVPSGGVLWGHCGPDSGEQCRGWSQQPRDGGHPQDLGQCSLQEVRIEGQGRWAEKAQVEREARALRSLQRLWEN